MRTTFHRAIATGFLLVLGYKCAYADQIVSGSFKGLNNNENSVIIDPSYAQDLLNVDVTPGGKSVKKRSGFGAFAVVNAPFHSGYHFFDSTGNDIQLWGEDTNLIAVINATLASFSAIVTSATVNSTWDCADTQGFAYCVDSNRDAFIKTNGTTMSWFTSPLGTMVETTPDRVIVAGVSGTPNTLYVSQSNTFTNFVTGVNATDAFTEVIASPGSKLTHIRWGCGKLLWWKDASFGYFDFDDQYTAQVKTVSDVIGTFDNTSAIDPGGRVWFRGQDAHTWMYDCSFLTKQSIDITPNIQQAGHRTSNSWTQTTQADWQSGVAVPSGNFSTTISVGDVVPSSYTATDTVLADFAQGTLSNTTSYDGISVRISTNNSGTATNSDFETQWSGGAGNWTRYYSSYFGSRNVSCLTGSCGTITPHGGSFQACEQTGANSSNKTKFQLLDVSSNVLDSVTFTNNCSYTLATLSSPSNAGKRVKFGFQRTGGPSCTANDCRLITSESYIFSGSASVYYVQDDADTVIDDVQNGSSTITTGSFTSRTFDTSITSTVVLGQANWTVNTSTPYFEVQSSSNSSGGPWFKVVGSSGTNGTNGARYVRYLSSFTVGSTESALTTFNDATIIAKSTGGVFYSAIKNAASINGWSTFSANTVLTGGTEAFYIRSSTNSFTVLSATPAWVAQSAGGIIAASTGTYFQIRDDFAVSSAVQSLSLTDFTVNWFEGTSTDQAYMIYFDNAIWEAVPFGSGQATNNYVFKYDLINEGWTIYDIPMNGMLIQNNQLYFAGPIRNLYIYGNATSDYGNNPPNPITAFWRSKSYTGNDPFLQNQLTNIDIFAKRDNSGALIATYTMDTSSSTAYTIALSSSNTVIQSRKLLPSGKLGYVFDLKLGDGSASSNWEFLGYRIGFSQQPYRPTTP